MWSWIAVGRVLKRSRLFLIYSAIDFFSINFLRTEAQIVEGHPEDPGGHGQSAQPFQRAFPNTHQPGHMGIRGQPAVSFRIGRVVQHVDDVRAADTGGS